MSSLLIKNIGLLATPLGTQSKKGKEQGNILLVKDAYIFIVDNIIKKVGNGNYQNADKTIDAKGKLVTPGLVDAHTHLVFGGWRQNEMAKKLKGASYLDILNEGGGILSTVNSSKKLSKEELISKAYQALEEMLQFGSTTVEAKSGYGLTYDEEIKELEVIKELNNRHVIDLVPTFLGAHALPEEYKNNRNEFIDEVCNKTIPYVAENKLAEFCDVFCEKDVFTAEEAEKILMTGQKYGLDSKIHADEIETIGGSVLAGKIKARSAEHLIVCDEKGIESMSNGGTVACLLPATSLYLGATFAPARKMIDKNVPVALATDFNPGSCPCLNMQLVMNLGCLKYKMTPEEVLTATTLNAAYAINRANEIGSIEEGKKADILIWNSNDLDYIYYRMGSNLINTVIKNGKVLIRNEKDN